MSVHLLILGSNITPETAIPRAIELLEERFGTLRKSRLVISPAVGAPGTPDFHNQAVLVGSRLAPDEVKAVCREIEAAMGRVRTEDRNAPRIIDIDHAADVSGGPRDVHLAKNAIRPMFEPPADRDLMTVPHLLVPAADLLPELALHGQYSTLLELVEARTEWPEGFRIVEGTASTW